MRTEFMIILGLCLFFQNAVSQDQNSDNITCLEDCLTQLQQDAPKLDAASVLSIGHIRSGNRSVMCPKTDVASMTSACGPFLKAKTCLEKCPNGQMKSLSTSGFAPLQLICIDRQNDFVSYMPCLGESCESVQATCQPKCGSFDDFSADILQLLRQIRGSPSTGQSVNVRIDPVNVTMIIAKACDTIECYGDCSRPLTTQKCGQGAYNLEMDTIWSLFSSMTQSMSSIGLSTPWPDSCKTLSARWGSHVAVSTTSSSVEVQNTNRSNSVDQFINKEQNKASVIVNNTATTPKCDGASCGTAPERSFSMFILFSCLIAAVISF